MFFLIPWVPNMMVWTLFLPGKNLLFKLILTGCAKGIKSNYAESSAAEASSVDAKYPKSVKNIE